MSSLADVTAAVLVGGLGTRLRSVVTDRPKALAEVRGRPFLAYLLDQLADSGVRRVVLCTGYRGEQIRRTFGEGYGGLHLVYSQEPWPLGTGGALRRALPLFDADVVLVMNGDSYCEAALSGFWEGYRGRATTGALVLTRVWDASPYGRVVLRGDRVVGFEEKRADGGPGWVNAGIYLLRRQVMETIAPAEMVSLEKEVLPGLVAQGLYGHRSRGRFIDIGTPMTIAMAEHILPMGEGEGLR